MAIWKQHDFLEDADSVTNGNEYLIGKDYDNLFIYLTVVGDSTDATLVFEGASVLGEYTSILAYDRSDASTATGADASTNSKWEVELNGLRKFRVRVSAINTGTVSASGLVVDDNA